MNEFVIFTDSACDLGPKHLNDIGVKHISLTLVYDGDITEYKNDDVNPKEFYDKMRGGATAKTSAVNSEAFCNAFREELINGNDILYIGFSSGLSTTYNSARLAAEELKEEFPERKIIAVDSLSASAGFGMLLDLAVKEKNKGATIEEVAKFVEDTRLHQCHWFTVDDLVYLKRGGRVSPTVAFVGGLLGIKPVLHMDDVGHLINVTKVRGRHAAIQALADKFGELAIDKTSGPVYICHGDCEDDANALAKIIKETYGVEVECTVYTGPVIGAHSGPGTLALFFIGKER
ncbi:MAG: DegV family protein [Clostridia bacterium]|nr:DegV family protein [Clostridia bacterium]